MKKAKEITGLQKYCFFSLGSKTLNQLGGETINDHFKNLDGKINNLLINREALLLKQVENIILIMKLLIVN